MKKRIVLFISISLVVLVPLIILSSPRPETRQAIAPRIFQIKVIDAVSGAPIGKADVTVEVQNSSKTKWTGRTDSKGIFSFTCGLANGSVRAHLSIEATGYWVLDDYFPLSEERVIELKKAD